MLELVSVILLFKLVLGSYKTKLQETIPFYDMKEYIFNLLRVYMKVNIN